MKAAYDLRRIRRLLLLLPAAARAARQGRGVPLAEAARLTGARSAKQVIEDVESLSSLWVDPGEGGDLVDLYVENGEVHALYSEPFGKPPALSLAEGAVLLAALAPFERDAGKPAREAARKLRKAIPEPLRPEADRLAAGLDVASEPPGPWAGALREAIASRVETTLEYRAVADAGAVKRVVEPRLLFQRDGQWYLAAWNVAKEAEHLFRLDRIVTVEPGTRLFGEHKGPPVARYARRSLYFESGAEREVTLRFGGDAARLARARYGARARAGSDGTVSLTLEVTPGNYLLGVVLGYGGEATVEGPADVVAALRGRVAKLQRLYGRPARGGVDGRPALAHGDAG
ncbi:MAG TPA: WYL domain-containing protein [Anaeromyxobacter sp.]|nr:WYL domain-containing protein [Anaeromyxobacter sp.]